MLTYMHIFCSRLDHYLLSQYNTMYSVMVPDTSLHFFQVELDSLPWDHQTVVLVSQFNISNHAKNKHYFCYSNTANLQITYVAQRGGYVIRRSTDNYEIVAIQQNNGYTLTMVCDLYITFKHSGNMTFFTVNMLLCC